MTSLPDATAEEIGDAMILLQDYVHSKSAGVEFDKAVKCAGRIVEVWTMHPKMRNWNLVQNIKYLVGGGKDQLGYWSV